MKGFPFNGPFHLCPSPFSSPNPTEHHRHPPAVCRRQDVKTSRKKRLGCESFSRGASSLTAFDVSRLYYNAQRATPPLSNRTAAEKEADGSVPNRPFTTSALLWGMAARVFALTRLECNSFWNLIVSPSHLSHEKMKKRNRGQTACSFENLPVPRKKASEMKESGEETPTERTRQLPLHFFFP